MEDLPEVFTLEQARRWAREHVRASSGRLSKNAIPKILERMKECKPISSDAQGHNLVTLAVLAGEIIRSTGSTADATKVGFWLGCQIHQEPKWHLTAHHAFLNMVRGLQVAVA